MIAKPDMNLSDYDDVLWQASPSLNAQEGWLYTMCQGDNWPDLQAVRWHMSSTCMPLRMPKNSAVSRPTTPMITQ